MAQANLLGDQQRRNEFPGVCAATGAPTTSVVAMKVVSAKTWTWILLPFGFLPFLIARTFSADVWTAQLPIHSSAWARYLRWRRLSWLLIAVGLGLSAAAFVESIPGESVALGILIIAGGAIVNVANAWWFPSVHRAGRDFPGFVVSRCDPAFAYEAGVLARRSAAMQRFLSAQHA